MTPQDMAEAFERARYEQLRGQQWTDLRDGERDTRTAVALRALEDSGIRDLTDRWRTTAERYDELTAVVAQRDAEIARRRAEHDAEITSLAAAHHAAASALTAQVAALRTELDDALTRARDAEGGADAAASVIAAVRSALADVPTQADRRTTTPGRPADRTADNAADSAESAPDVDLADGAPSPGGRPAQPAQPASTGTTARASEPAAAAPTKKRFATSRLARAGANRG